MREEISGETLSSDIKPSRRDDVDRFLWMRSMTLEDVDERVSISPCIESRRETTDSWSLKTRSVSERMEERPCSRAESLSEKSVIVELSNKIALRTWQGLMSEQVWQAKELPVECLVKRRVQVGWKLFPQIPSHTRGSPRMGLLQTAQVSEDIVTQ